MSPTPSIPPAQPSDKDPPPSSPPPTSHRPSELRIPSYKDNNNSMPPPPRPAINTRTTSFDPQPHILNPSPLLPSLGVESASQSLSTSRPPQSSESQQQQLQQTHFTPFFTLVNDTSTKSTYHPSKVHYIFSDDDASEVLTSSLLKSATTQAQEGDLGNEVLSRESLEHSSSGRGGTGTTSSSSSATFRKEDRKKGREKKNREERVIIVDINLALDGVTRVSSLSKEWQVLNASIEHAPTFDPSGEEGAGDKGLMLKIEGVGVESFKSDAEEGKGLGIRGSGSGSGMGEEEMQALLEGFDRKMAVLRKVVGFGGVGKEVAPEV